MHLLIAASLALLPAFAAAESKPAPTPAAVAEKAPEAAPQNPEAVDISGLEQDYWRPNKDELESVQNRRFEKAHKFEFATHLGIYQGKDYVNSKSIGASLTYNFSNQIFVEASFHKVNNSDNDFLNSVRNRFGFTPDFNREESQTVLSAGWTPIYAKFSLLGKKISHFEMFFAPGAGITKTADNHFSGHFTVGQKYFLTEHFLFRLEWRISQFTDRIKTTQGSTSVANGGSGYTDQSETTHNIIFGLGVMF